MEQEGIIREILTSAQSLSRSGEDNRKDQRTLATDPRVQIPGHLHQVLHHALVVDHHDARLLWIEY